MEYNKIVVKLLLAISCIMAGILLMIGSIYSSMNGFGTIGAVMGIVGIAFVLIKFNKMEKKIENATIEE